MAPSPLIEIFTENKPESLPEILLEKVYARWQELCNNLSLTRKKEDRDEIIRDFLSWGMENPRVEYDYEYSPAFTFGIDLPVGYLNDLPDDLYTGSKGCVGIIIIKETVDNSALIVITGNERSDLEKKLSGGYSDCDVINMLEGYLCK